MEDQAFESAPAPRPGFLNPLNLLAFVFVALSCVSCFCVATVFANPGVLPAAFRPPTMPVVVSLTPTPTPTNTSAFPTFPPTWTATFTPGPTDTRLPQDTATPTPTWTPRGPTNTPTNTLTPTRTPTFTPTASPTGPTPTPTKTRSPYPFVLQPGSPAYLPNFANTAGCNWMGFAGQVFDLNGQPRIGYFIHITTGDGLSYDFVTGSGPAAYGAGSWEYGGFQNHPIATDGWYKIQLRDSAGTPLSAVISLTTYADCNKALTLVNFVQVY